VDEDVAVDAEELFAESAFIDDFIGDLVCHLPEGLEAGVALPDPAVAV